MAADPLRGAAPRVRQHARLSDAELVEKVRGSVPQQLPDTRLLACGRCDRPLQSDSDGFLACTSCQPRCSCRGPIVVSKDQTRIALICKFCRRAAQHQHQPTRMP